MIPRLTGPGSPALRINSGRTGTYSDCLMSFFPNGLDKIPGREEISLSMIWPPDETNFMDAFSRSRLGPKAIPVHTVSELIGSPVDASNSSMVERPESRPRNGPAPLHVAT